MKSVLSVLLFIQAFICSAQSLSDAQLKAVNNYIEWANALTKEVNELGPSLVRPYSFIPEYRKNSFRQPAQHYCGLDPQPYFKENAKKTSAAVGNSAIIARANEIEIAYDKLDATCKEIEIYYRLKDYESDKFKKLEDLIAVLKTQTSEYHKK